MNEEINRVTDQVIGAAIEVHRATILTKHGPRRLAL